MKTMTLDDDRASTNVYVIMRVFNLGQDNIGMRLYVDPAAMELDGRLMFEPSNYTVTPGPTVEAAVDSNTDEEL